MQAEGDAEKDSPKEEADANFDAADQRADGEETMARVVRESSELADPNVEAIAGKVGHVAGEAAVCECMALPEMIQPAWDHQCLPAGCGVALLVAVLMMDAVGANPADGAAFK